LFHDEHYDKEAYTRAIRALDTIQKSVDRLRPICEEHKDIKKKQDEEEKKQQEENKKSAAAQKILERVEAED
jgi:RPA family protein